MINRKIILFLFVIFIIAFLLRLVPIFRTPNIVEADQAYYHGTAIEILKDPGYIINSIPLSFRPPGYTIFLAAIYSLFGENLYTIKIIQALMGSFLCILIYYLGEKVFSKSIGLISSSLLAFNLSFIYMPANILSENLFMIIFLVSILYFIKMWSYPSFKNRALLGFTLGLAVLVRAEILLLPFFILLAMIIKAKYERQKILHALKSFMVIVLFFILPIIPWTIRNYRVHHAFLPISLAGGITLYASYAVPNIKGFGGGVDDEVTRKAKITPMSEIERSKYYYKEAFKYIRGHLSKLPKLIFFKTLLFWSPLGWELTKGIGKYNSMFVFSLPFFILGAILLRKRILDFLPLFIPILYCFFIAVAIQGRPRLRAQVEPCIIIISAIGIWFFLKKHASKLIPYLIISSFLAINFVIYLYIEPIKSILKHILQGWGLW